VVSPIEGTPAWRSVSSPGIHHPYQRARARSRSRPRMPWIASRPQGTKVNELRSPARPGKTSRADHHEGRNPALTASPTAFMLQEGGGYYFCPQLCRKNRSDRVRRKAGKLYDRPGDEEPGSRPQGNPGRGPVPAVEIGDEFLPKGGPHRLGQGRNEGTISSSRHAAQ